jgi:hypothetical protein
MIESTNVTHHKTRLCSHHTEGPSKEGNLQHQALPTLRLFAHAEDSVRRQSYSCTPCAPNRAMRATASSTHSF